MSYSRGVVPGNATALPVFLRTELERIQRAIAATASTWDSVTDKPANVTALGALVGSSDTVPYFTGLGAMALASLSIYGRTLIACASALAARTALGLGTLATASVVLETDLSLSDVTTANSSTTKHGLLKKLPNNAGQFMDGTGNWSTPSGGGAGALPAFPTLAGTQQLILSSESTICTYTKQTDGFISSMTDASGNWGSTFTAAGTARPRWIKRGMQCGRPGIQFDGVVSKLVAGGTKAIAQPFTVVIAFQNWANGSVNSNLFRDSNLGPVVFISGGSQMASFAGTGLTSTALLTQNRQATIRGSIGAPMVLIAVFNGASGILSNNGVEAAGAVGATGITGTMRIGGDASTSFAEVLLYEIRIVSGAMSVGDRALINTYYSTALELDL